MKTSIITFLQIGLFTVVTTLSSCTSTPEKEQNKTEAKETENPIARKWALSDEKTVKDQTTKVIMSLEENGYFIIYDTIIEPKFTAAGINKIQPISKGQWKYKDDKLTLNHLLPDSNNVEVFNVKTLNTDKLVILGSNKKSHTYLAY